MTYAEIDHSPLGRCRWVAGQLGLFRYRFGNENELQLGVKLALEQAISTRVFREHRLGPDSVIDFFLPDFRIGIECKIGGGFSTVSKQLDRYAEHPEIEALVLVTSRCGHQCEDLDFRGKPVRVVYVGGLRL